MEVLVPASQRFSPDRNPIHDLRQVHWDVPWRLKRRTVGKHIWGAWRQRGERWEISLPWHRQYSFIWTHPVRRLSIRICSVSLRWNRRRSYGRHRGSEGKNRQIVFSSLCSVHHAVLWFWDFNGARLQWLLDYPLDAESSSVLAKSTELVYCNRVDIMHILQLDLVWSEPVWFILWNKLRHLLNRRLGECWSIFRVFLHAFILSNHAPRSLLSRDKVVREINRHFTWPDWRLHGADLGFAQPVPRWLWVFFVQHSADQWDLLNDRWESNEERSSAYKSRRSSARPNKGSRNLSSLSVLLFRVPNLDASLITLLL